MGGTLGHALCTALAVIGGKIVAQRISVRTGKDGNVIVPSFHITFSLPPCTVTLIGGVVFLIFALTAFLHSTDDSEPLT